MVVYHRAHFCFPLIAAGFVNAAIISLSKGEPTRIAMGDQSGKIAVEENLSAERMTAKAVMKDSMKNLDAPTDEKNEKTALNSLSNLFNVFYRLQRRPKKSLSSIRTQNSAKNYWLKELDAYLVIPKPPMRLTRNTEVSLRKASDFGGERKFARRALNEADCVRSVWRARISTKRDEDLSRNVDFDAKSLDEKGDEKKIPDSVLHLWLSV